MAKVKLIPPNKRIRGKIGDLSYRWMHGLQTVIKTEKEIRLFYQTFYLVEAWQLFGTIPCNATQTPALAAGLAARDGLCEKHGSRGF
jgi:hypothetical protein